MSNLEWLLLDSTKISSSGIDQLAGLRYFKILILNDGPIAAHGFSSLGKLTGLQLNEIDRIFAIGSDRMMAAVTEARHGILQTFFKGDHVGIASINSLMQCIMKEVCAQCLQKQVNPVTKQEVPAVFSWLNQDQEMDRVDFGNLRERLRSNSLAEKLSNRELDVLLTLNTDSDPVRQL